MFLSIRLEDLMRFLQNSLKNTYCKTYKSKAHNEICTSYNMDSLMSIVHNSLEVILQFWFLMNTRFPTVYVIGVFRIVNHFNRVLSYIRWNSGFKNFFSISFGSKVMIQIRYFYVLICDYTLITLLSIVAGFSGDMKMIQVIAAIQEE